jgi:hypothetical protein
MIACPEDLDPKNVCTHVKRQLAAQGRKWEPDPDPHRADLHLDNRRIPIGRLIRKLGLSSFTNEGPLVEPDYQPRRVVLPLKQHAGAPARPVVEDGSRVKKGDLVASPDDGTLGARIHAGIAGTCQVHQDRVIITAAP